MKMDKEKQNINKVGSNAIKKDSIYKRRWGNQFSLKYTPELIEQIADELFQWLEADESNLFFNKFFASRKISRKVIKGFIEKNEYFAFIYDLAKMIQEERLFMQGSIAKNQAMYIIALKNNHGWKDKQEIEQTNIERVTGFVMEKPRTKNIE